MTIDQTLQQGIVHHQAGRLQQAEANYRQILAQFPNHPDALHLMGVIAGQAGRHDLATDFFQKAIAVSPQNADFHRNLGFSLQNQGQFTTAAESFGRVAALVPNNPDVHFQLGNARWNAGDFEKALVAYDRVLALNPRHVDAHNNMGSALLKLGRPDRAAQAFERALSLQPNFLQAHCNLVSALVDQKKLDDAIFCCTRALALHPANAEIHNHLGNAFYGKALFDEAIISYRRALEIDPTYAEVHNNIGNVLGKKGQIAQALECYRRALELAPQNAEFHFSIGVALQADKQLDEAIQSYHRGLELNPGDSKIYHNLARAWKEQDDLPKAIAAAEKAVELKPDHTEAILNLALYLSEDQRKTEAVQRLEQVIRIKPDFAEAHNNFGVIYQELGQLDQAIGCYQKAVRCKSDYVEALNNLANAWKDDGQFARAIALYKKTLARSGDQINTLSGLGSAYKEANDTDNAIACFEKALSIDQNDPGALAGIGGALYEIGQVNSALMNLYRSLELRPRQLETRDGLLWTMLYDPQSTPQSILTQKRKWNELHAEPLRKFIKPLSNDPNPDRKLRIGYVSADFRQHPVGRFVLPLFSNHDRSRFEIFCYSNATTPDEITPQIQKLSDHWRNIFNQPDEETARQVRDDQIDILVDLSMHTRGHRLLVFARKPAPVQATYLAYADGSALSLMDYRLTDRYLDPDESLDGDYMEKSIRLESTYWCYEPNDAAPAVGQVPALTTPTLTLGCLNKIGKISSDALELWSKVLGHLPTAQLHLHARPGKHRDRILEVLVDLGVARQRVEFLPPMLLGDYFAAYNRIDIALDPFPFNGGTTTCDALWMGVPVVTLAGKLAVGRASASILSNIGLPQFIATTPEQYIQIVVDLAKDLPRLSELRSTLRQRMRDSPLMDAPRFANSMEAAYRTMWRKWCAENNSVIDRDVVEKNPS